MKKKRLGVNIAHVATIRNARGEKYPDPLNPGEYYKFRMDMKHIKRYDKMCFMDAAEEIGLFDVE